jgi:D-psicose/D-tagatose/L-ribulose 3-epimerase
MKIGVNTLLWTAGFDRSHFDLLPRIKRWGFDGVEIARFEFDTFPIAEVKRAVSDAGLECTFCSALTGSMSLVSDDAQVRNQAREFIARGVEVAAELGSDVFLGPFCAPVGQLLGRRRTKDEWKWAVEQLALLGPVLDQHGVSLALEPLKSL